MKSQRSQTAKRKPRFSDRRAKGRDVHLPFFQADLNQMTILIDGNNISYRHYWAFKKSSRTGGVSARECGQETCVIRGVLDEIAFLKRKYPGSRVVVAWDGGGSIRRIKETKRAVESGLIKTGYKEGRVRDNQDTQSVQVQMSFLKTEILPVVAVCQCEIKGFEGDDIICSYIESGNGDFVISSSDKDFFQLLRPGVFIDDMMNRRVVTAESFLSDYGFPPCLYVDYGALVGEGGDNIPGVDGCGDKTARALVAKSGTLEKIIKEISAKDNRTKAEQSILDNLDVAHLSYSLKKMDVIPVPPIEIKKKSVQEIRKMLIKWGFMSLLKAADILSE